MPLAAGSRLGSYEIIALLGAGGMGEVYRARDLTLKREVAIKVLRAYCAHEPDRLRRFELEAQSAAALDHPNIVSIFHLGEHAGAPYIVTELLGKVQGFSATTIRHRLNLPKNGAGCNGMLPLSTTLCCHWRHSRRTINPAARCNPILPFNSKRSRLPNPAIRGGMATPVGETGSKVRFV
jgi:hypothetical protein